MSTNSRIRVAVVGAGASGMSTTYALSQHPDKYHVTVFDKEPQAGGMATSIPIDKSKYGADYINDGVQGCSPAFANTMKMFDLLGFQCKEVGMQISFGKDENFWSNVFPSELVRKFSKDIRKFGRALKVIKMFEPIFAFIPVRVMLKIFRFSSDFGERMVYPLVALFFGTGNQTPFISSAILERVFMDPSMRLFEYNEKSLLASIPTMLGFPNLHDTYQAWRNNISSSGCVEFRLSHEVVRVISRSRRGGVVLEHKTPDSSELVKADFDEIVFACDADSALKILDKAATWRERRVLGSVKYLYDVTITHSDLDYMKKHYETAFKSSLAAEPEDDQDRKAIETGEKKFRPLYYTKQYEEDRSKIEMSFDLTHYQPQFRNSPPTGGKNVGADEEGSPEPGMDAHVFQTIFLDRDDSEHLWTINEIPEEKRIYKKWWKQQSHRWQHYAKVVPFMMFINGKYHTHFAGAWSVLNMHELAMTSGFAAAYRLGAKFPFTDDEDCTRLFRLYLALSHGVRLRKEDRASFWA